MSKTEIRSCKEMIDVVHETLEVQKYHLIFSMERTIINPARSTAEGFNRLAYAGRTCGCFAIPTSGPQVTAVLVALAAMLW